MLPDLISRAEALVDENNCLKNGFKGPQKSPSTLPSTSSTHKTQTQESDFENDEPEGDLPQPTTKILLPKPINSENRPNPDEKAAAATNDDEDIYDIGDIYEIDDGKSAKKVITIWDRIEFE